MAKHSKPTDTTTDTDTTDKAENMIPDFTIPTDNDVTTYARHAEKRWTDDDKSPDTVRRLATAEYESAIGSIFTILAFTGMIPYKADRPVPSVKIPKDFDAFLTHVVTVMRPKLAAFHGEGLAMFDKIVSLAWTAARAYQILPAEPPKNAGGRKADTDVASRFFA
jgi:hypothetical protein